jgi:hypothetical protein
MNESLDKIKKMVCEGLDQMAMKGELSPSNLDHVDKLCHTLKSIETIQAMKGSDNGYSGRYMTRYSRGDEYDGHSYTGGSNSNNGGGSYGFYSRENGTELANELRHMLERTNSERDRRALQDCITKMGG